MKSTIIELLSRAVEELIEAEIVDKTALDLIGVERTRDARHGDFACNLAMKLAKPLKSDPKELAQTIVRFIPKSEAVDRVEVAGPGFINFHLSENACRNLITHIREQGAQYGKSSVGKGQSVMVEFVSTNPTGPLHVGHGRGAAFGDALVRVLKAAGYAAHSEYYINDAGRQMDILALSVWLRYLALYESAVSFPANGYRGGYVKNIAAALKESEGDVFRADAEKLFDRLPEDAEQSIDVLISRCRDALGERHYRTVFDTACNAMIEDIRRDLEEFGVVFDKWFSERSLLENGDIESAVDTLEKNGRILEKEGAKWFKATDFGDEKDRVVVRANGMHTYFASDIAYHRNKANRGFDRIINIFGSDHHGYIKRIYASFEALGNDPERLKFLLVQFAVLYRGGRKVPMSTRGGEFVTLRELRNEVGNDAARFFYVSRKADQHMDFDLDLAKSRSSENPVYYVQYAHARICGVFRQLEQKGMSVSGGDMPDYALLAEPEEQDLLTALSRFPEVVELAADGYAPHQIAYYLRDLASAFHGYYNAHPFLASEDELRLARLGLIDSVRVVIANGLHILGVSAPEKM